MKNQLVIALVSVCLSFAGFGANDDAAVANRKWVRAQIAKITQTIGSKTNAVKQSDSPVVTKAGTVSFGTGTNATVRLYTPTNAGLFVAWSTVPEVPRHTFFAKVPGSRTYANVSNTFFAAITYTTTNGIEAAQRNGKTVTCEHSRTTWTATDRNGAAWRSAYLDSNTALCMVTNPANYIIIQRTNITDERKAALLFNYTVADNAPVRRFSFAALLFPTAYADDHHIEVERGGGTLGFHAGVALDFTITVTDKRINGTFTIQGGGDHQYNPYGGMDHAELNANEAGYKSYSEISNPENWGFTFPLLMVDENGNQFYINKKQFANSDEWLAFVDEIELPAPNEVDEPEIDDPSQHVCKVYQTNQDGTATHCKYCPRCNSEYTITKTWSDGAKEEETKKLHFIGAEHNWKYIIYGTLQNGGMGDVEDDDGCCICYEEPGKNFCGNGALNNLDDSHNYTKHIVNDPNVTGRDECGCMCREYWAGH